MIMGKRAYMELPPIQYVAMEPRKTNIVPQPGVKYRGEMIGLASVIWLDEERGCIAWEQVSFRKQDAPKEGKTNG